VKYQIYNSHNKNPRRLKKKVLGTKISKNKLRKLLASVRIITHHGRTMFSRDWLEIYPYYFCPKCGCKEFEGSGNMAEYPEHWEEFNCLRCRYQVAEIDNSPFCHVLEFERRGSV
jgi:hypothetical protein